MIDFIKEYYQYYFAIGFLVTAFSILATYKTRTSFTAAFIIAHILICLTWVLYVVGFIYFLTMGNKTHAAKK